MPCTIIEPSIYKGGEDGDVCFKKKCVGGGKELVDSNPFEVQGETPPI